MTLMEAAQDLGCPPWKAFWLITFPLSLPGVFAGSLLVFVPALGEFVIPDLLGGSETLMIGAYPLDRVLQQPRLAAGFGRGDRPAGGDRRADAALPHAEARRLETAR